MRLSKKEIDAFLQKVLVLGHRNCPKGLSLRLRCTKLKNGTSKFPCYTSFPKIQETPIVSCATLSTKCGEPPLVANSSSQNIEGEQKEACCLAFKTLKINTLRLPATDERRVRELSGSLVQDQCPVREKQVEVPRRKTTQRQISRIKHPQDQQKKSREEVVVAKPVSVRGNVTVEGPRRRRSPAVQNERKISKPTLVCQTRVAVKVSKREGGQGGRGTINKKFTPGEHELWMPRAWVSIYTTWINKEKTER